MLTHWSYISCTNPSTFSISVSGAEIWILFMLNTPFIKLTNQLKSCLQSNIFLISVFSTTSMHHYRGVTDLRLQFTSMSEQQTCRTNPTMHHCHIPQCTILWQKCACVHISVTKWCIVGYLSNALWDLWDRSVPTVRLADCSESFTRLTAGPRSNHTKPTACIHIYFLYWHWMQTFLHKS